MLSISNFLSSSDRDAEAQKNKNKDANKRDDLASKEVMMLTKGPFPLRTYKSLSNNIRNNPTEL